MVIGGFVSTAGGIGKVIERAKALTMAAPMIFAASPRGWARRTMADEDVAQFRADFMTAGFHSLWVHGIYLMNFATDNPELLKKSQEALLADLKDCALLGGAGVMFHLGSHKGRGLASALDQVTGSLSEVLAKAPKDVLVMLENSAGMGGSVGSKFDELAQILAPFRADPRVGVCLDTQHSFAAGYPVHTTEGLTKTLKEFDETVGLDRLFCLHVNDSKVAFGGGKDRHENIGDGSIGTAGFKMMAANPTLAKLPWLLEVPGLDDTGPDKPNVDRLRQLANG